jgi:hypothetical protein
MRVHLCERVRVRAFVIMLSVCIWCVRTCVCGLCVRAGVRVGMQRTCAHSLPPPPARPPPTAPHTHGRTHINTHAHAHTSVCTQAHASMHAQKRAQIADSQRCVRAAMHADPPLHPLSPPEPRTTEDQKPTHPHWEMRISRDACTSVPLCTHQSARTTSHNLPPVSISYGAPAHPADPSGCAYRRVYPHAQRHAPTRTRTHIKARCAACRHAR